MIIIYLILGIVAIAGTVAFLISTSKRSDFEFPPVKADKQLYSSTISPSKVNGK